MIGIAVVSVAVFALLWHSWSAKRFRLGVGESMDRLRRRRPGVRPVPTENLPDAVLRLIQLAGVPESEPPNTIQLTQRAQMRMGPDKPWQELLCEQVIAIHRPGFVWFADQRRGPLSFLQVVDQLVEGRGLLQARLLGSIPVARLEGAEADKSELMRYLAELAWAPDAARFNGALRWRDVGERAGAHVGKSVVEVSADSSGGLASVRLYFNDAGDLIEIQADERGSTENGRVVQRPWLGRFAEHRMMNGRRIPTRGEVGYVYEEGYSAYWRGEIIDYRLD